MRQIREQNCGDISNELAPTEHFAYARMEVSKGGPNKFGNMILNVGLQDSFKRLPEWVQRTLGTKSGECPIAPRTIEERLMGAAGAARGLNDYLREHSTLFVRLERGERIRTDTLDRRERDRVDWGREWA